MEEIREDRIGSVLAWLQSGARGKASRMQFKKLQDQKLALYSCQRAIKTYMIAKNSSRIFWSMPTAAVAESGPRGTDWRHRNSASPGLPMSLPKREPTSFLVARGGVETVVRRTSI